jgi:DNA-binding GntR family transcriptional regulator
VTDSTTLAPLYRSAASVAAEAIRNAILDGRFAPGDELREVALAKELGLSRTPIREALLALQATGLVETTRGRVARVRRRSAAELMDTYELRAAVEGYTARRAAERISEAELEELWASCDRFAGHLGTDDYRVLVQENLAFHGIIHRASRNNRAPEVVRNLLEMPLLYASYAWYSPERRVLTEQHHREIAQALADRDGDRAEALMREHILDAGRAAIVAHEAGEREASGQAAATGSTGGDDAAAADEPAA